MTFCFLFQVIIVTRINTHLLVWLESPQFLDGKKENAVKKENGKKEEKRTNVHKKYTGRQTHAVRTK